jgi:hypothetical protein
MKRCLIAPALFVVGCGAADVGPSTNGSYDGPLSPRRSYVTDAEYRRSELEASLVNPNNDYSRLRLERYTEGDWGSLPEWNPLASPIEAGSAPPPDARDPSFTRLDVESVPWEERALVDPDVAHSSSTRLSSRRICAWRFGDAERHRSTGCG